jgi:hypothetical protein
MEIILVIFGAILGGLISLVISHVYYVKSGLDQRKILDKLDDSVKAIIIQDKRKSLSVRDLNALLEEMTIKSPKGNDPLPYKACPRCGSKHLERNSATDYEHDNIYYFIECRECEWQEYTE